MDLVTALFGALQAGFSLWQAKEATKYRDELISIQRDYYAEKNKSDPNMALLDNLEQRLFVLSRSFAAGVTQAPEPKVSITSR